MHIEVIDVDVEDDVLSFREAKLCFEKEYCHALLFRTDGNITHAAQLCGKTRRSFYELMERCDVDPNKFRATGIWHRIKERQKKELGL